MKIIIQKVLQATLKYTDQNSNNLVTKQIDRGLFISLGIHQDDTENQVDDLVKKVLKMKIFENQTKKYQTSVVDKDYEIMVVSVQAIQAKLKQNKFQFHQAKEFEDAKEIYDMFCQKLQDLYKQEKIVYGGYGLYKECTCVNEGPVSVILDN